MIIALAAILILGLSARAEVDGMALLNRSGFEQVAELSREMGGIDVREVAERILSGDFALEDIDAREWLGRLAASIRCSLTDALKALAVPVLASLALKTLLGERAEGTAALLCRLACAALLMERFVQARQIAEAALEASLRMMKVASPALATLMTLTGAAGRAAILTPSTALCAALAEDALRGAGLGLCGVAAAVAASANLSKAFQLNRLFELVRRLTTWGVRLLLVGFVGLMALEGLMAGSQDAVSARAFRRLLQAALPIVGGEVSDSAGALLGSAAAVRNAAGIAGMLAVAGVCAAPIVRLLIRALSLRLAGTILEPVADDGVTRIVGHFADIDRMLLAICAGSAMLSVLTLGACLGFPASY